MEGAVASRFPQTIAPRKAAFAHRATEWGGGDVGLGFYFDNARCTGCRTCVMACMDFHALEAGHLYRRVIDCEGGETACGVDGTCTTDAFAYHVSLACNHCDQPACMEVCPTGAMHKDGLGLVQVDHMRCIGCGYCTIACPYHAPSIDPALHQSSKCDGCTSRMEAGKNPICVDACPLRALGWGERTDLAAAHAGEDLTYAVLPLPPSSCTYPNLTIHASAAARRAQEGDLAIANVDELGF